MYRLNNSCTIQLRFRTFYLIIFLRIIIIIIISNLQCKVTKLKIEHRYITTANLIKKIQLAVVKRIVLRLHLKLLKLYYLESFEAQNYSRVTHITCEYVENKRLQSGLPWKFTTRIFLSVRKLKSNVKDWPYP